ncbi:hypothetical protein TNCV_2696811 [Trichonephila clavipes]|nr:hypothetical protein TNCV_2696811 [Trichonephila clavipes]
MKNCWRAWSWSDSSGGESMVSRGSSESSPTAMESILNKWYCQPERSAKAATAQRRQHRIAIWQKVHDDIGGQQLLSLLVTFLSVQEEFQANSLQTF